MAVLLDGLHGKGPQVRLLRELDMNFAVGGRRADHEALYGQIEVDGEEHEFRDPDGTVHRFRRRNGAETDNGNRDLLVNAVEYVQTTPAREIRKAGGRTRTEPEATVRFGWITDFEIDRELLMPTVRAGRARWRMENETFNALKNQGCNLAHSQCHGRRNPVSVPALLMLPAFLIDQVQELCCPAFQAARRTVRSRATLWHRMRANLAAVFLTGWGHLMQRPAGNRTRSPPAASA